MKRLLVSLMGMALLGLAGCNQGAPGGPGVTGPPAKNPFQGQADNTFNLSVPVLSTTIKQGETKRVSISIKRATNFDEDVALKFSALPPGVTFDPARPVIKHGDTEAKLALKATNTAALGDFTLYVVGHPKKGADASIEFKISVAKR
jgi:hypothetical protein